MYINFECSDLADLYSINNLINEAQENYNKLLAPGSLFKICHFTGNYLEDISDVGSFIVNKYKNFQFHIKTDDLGRFADLHAGDLINTYTTFVNQSDSNSFWFPQSKTLTCKVSFIKE